MAGRVWVIVIVGVLAIVGIGAVNNAKPNPNPSASTNATLNVIASMRSITVSPGQVTFSHCSGGSSDNPSTPTQLGYPYASCSVGRLKDHHALPITIDNTGPKAKIQVFASNAMPSGSGPQWRLCVPKTSVPCTSDSEPGDNQFEAWTIAKGNVRTNLTANATCDPDFSANGCAAKRGQSGHEGIELLGPKSFMSTSTSYTVTVTWLAAPP